jgi:hypothetical protein
MRILATIEQKKLRVGFQDEARFGRINNPMRCWAKRGVRPWTYKQIIREYSYAYGVFFPEDGDMVSLVLPYMDASCMNIFLEETSQRYPNDLVLMIMDGAPCHRTDGEALVIPDNIFILKLPPYCPQLNPAENMWDDIREKDFANCSFESLALLEQHLAMSLQRYERSPQTVKSICDWPWISHEIRSISIAD